MPRAETTAERRAAILAAAIRVLARDGLAATTTRKIAAAAGVNQAMLGYYFGGKDELLFEVLRTMMQATESVAREALPPGTAPQEAIAAGIRAFWAQVEAAPELQVMQYELTLYALRRPASAWLAQRQYAGYVAVVETLFRAAYAAAGESCALAYDEAARFVVGGLDGVILQFVSDRNLARARRDLEHLIAAICALASGQAASIAQREAAARHPVEGGRR
ncbi:MAG: TetR/AcrR family transcriptional regulator [Ktedonobacterales bacterium]